MGHIFSDLKVQPKGKFERLMIDNDFSIEKKIVLLSNAHILQSIVLYII